MLEGAPEPIHAPRRHHIEVAPRNAVEEPDRVQAASHVRSCRRCRDRRAGGIAQRFCTARCRRVIAAPRSAVTA